MMNFRERTLAILNYEKFDKMPVAHFAFWDETIDKWIAEGHVPEEYRHDHRRVAGLCGFDEEFDWCALAYGGAGFLQPGFPSEVVREFPDGTRYIRNGFGVVEVHKPGAGSIPGEVEHLLEDRESWEEHYLPRLQYSDDRIPESFIQLMKSRENSDFPVGYFGGSLLGDVRNCLGVEGLAYVWVDDPELLKEIIDTVGDLYYRMLKRLVDAGVKIDYIHFWEDICFKNGPLVTPAFFEEVVGPNYGRIADLAHQHGIRYMSVDCDGCIDKLIPTWLHNGVNVMFPIEVGTWDASIAPWRKQYGREIRGIGGMNKNVFARDRKAVDEEVERLQRLIALGGYIPCPDHRIAPDAQFELVQYYCDKMQNLRI